MSQKLDICSLYYDQFFKWTIYDLDFIKNFNFESSLVQLLTISQMKPFDQKYRPLEQKYFEKMKQLKGKTFDYPDNNINEFIFCEQF